MTAAAESVVRDLEAADAPDSTAIVRGTWRGDALAVSGIALAWLVMTLVVHPAGDFPLADDWAYASPVRRLLTDGTLAFLPWTPAISLTHTLWGALVAGAFGTSYPVLRGSMLALGLIGTLATFLLLRQLRVPPRWALLGALTLAANPIYFQLAGTFMTDVSFVVGSTLTCCALLAALRSEHRGTLVVAALLSLATTLNRQIGLALPLAFAVAALATRTASPLRALVPGLVTGAGLAAWLLLGGASRSLVHNVKTAEMAAFLAGPDVAPRVLWNATGQLLYLGLFCLPFVMPAWSAARRARRGPALSVALCASVAMLCWLALGLPLMPFVGNILLASGTGPATLRDTQILGLPHLPEAPPALRALLTLASLGGATALLYLLVAAAGDRGASRFSRVERATRTLLGVLAALYLAPNLISPYFDRYLLPVLPLALGLCAYPLRERPSEMGTQPSHRASAGAALALVVSALFSVAAVHDYLGWNRARWQAASWLVDEYGASPSAIDGGFEWNAAQLYDSSWVTRPGKSWWWVDDDRWVLSFGELPERRTVHEVAWARWLPPFGNGHVLALERSGERGE